MTRSRRTGRALVGLAVLAVLGGCGVPVDEEPRAVPPGAAVSSPSPTPTAASALAVVWLVRDDRLVPRRTPVVPPPSPEAALRALLERVPAAPGRARSAVPAGTELLSLTTEAGVGTVDLSPAFAAAGGEELRLAIAQVVYTLTEPGGGLVGVRLRIAGTPADVPLRDASLSDQPLTRREYADLVARR